jgi:hypothetical protein
MVQAKNFDSGCSSFQLDDRSRRDHHSLGDLSKLPLSDVRFTPKSGHRQATVECPLCAKTGSRS